MLQINLDQPFSAKFVRCTRMNFSLIRLVFTEKTLTRSFQFLSDEVPGQQQSILIFRFFRLNFD